MDVVEMLVFVGGFDLVCMLGIYVGVVFNKKFIFVDGFILLVVVLLVCSLNKNI